jgi:carbonic anhydrase/acetyltransferase-like protein (isoleucine patch superfamily)
MLDRTRRLINYLYWRRKLGWFARSAYLGWPDLLMNPQGISLDWGAMIRRHARLECHQHGGKLGRIVIGEATTAQFYFHCAAAELVTIGQGVLIAGRVYISDHDHAMPWTSGRLVVAPVTIGDGCWLGEGCAVLKGVTLGEGCVVGTNAVVTRSFPAGSIIAGVPAKLLKRVDSTTGEVTPADPALSSQGR